MRFRSTRLVIIASFGILLLPVSAVNAQRSAKTARIGVLSPSADSFLDIFKQALRDLGYVEGRNIAIDYRSADGRADRLLELANELARLKVDIIVTITSPGVRAAKQATRTIPIVMGAIDDAVEQGFVASLARPGANVTGTSWLNPELSAKRLELLKEAFPRLSRAAVLREAVGGASSLRATMETSRILGVQLQILELREANEIDSAFAAMLRERVGALDVLPGPMITGHINEIAQRVGKGRLPGIFPDARFVEAGGLMSYGPVSSEMYRRAATYVDKILKGAKPAELPVEQPTKFELVINLKADKQFGLTIPPNMLARADRVIK